MKNVEHTTTHQQQGRRWQVFKNVLWFLMGGGIIGIFVYAVISAPPVTISAVHYTRTGKEECEVVFTATNTSTKTVRTQLGVVVYAEGYEIPTEGKNSVWVVIGRTQVQLVLQPHQSKTVHVRIHVLHYPFSPKRDVRVFVGKTQKLD